MRKPSKPDLATRSSDGSLSVIGFDRFEAFKPAGGRWNSNIPRGTFVDDVIMLAPAEAEKVSDEARFSILSDQWAQEFCDNLNRNVLAGIEANY